jgi:hypothetical protein
MFSWIIVFLLRDLSIHGVSGNFSSYMAYIVPFFVVTIGAAIINKSEKIEKAWTNRSITGKILIISCLYTGIAICCFLATAVLSWLNIVTYFDGDAFTGFWMLYITTAYVLWVIVAIVVAMIFIRKKLMS